jgi:hypothetical protein
VSLVFEITITRRWNYQGGRQISAVILTRHLFLVVENDTLPSRRYAYCVGAFLGRKALISEEEELNIRALLRRHDISDEQLKNLIERVMVEFKAFAGYPGFRVL